MSDPAPLPSLAASAAGLAHALGDTVKVRRVILAADNIRQLSAWAVREFGGILHPAAVDTLTPSPGSVQFHGVRYVEEPAPPSDKKDDGRFYVGDVGGHIAFGGQRIGDAKAVFRAPRSRDAGNGTKSISMGFPVCITHPAAGDAALATIAEALNRMLDAGDIDP